MNSLLPNPLVDEEQPQAPPRTPKQVAADAKQPATVGWVLELFEGHPLNCPAMRALIKMRLWIACGFGAFSVAIVAAGLIVNAQNEANALRLEAKIVKVVREEIGARTGHATAPAPSNSPTLETSVFQLIPSANAAVNP